MDLEDDLEVVREGSRKRKREKERWMEGAIFVPHTPGSKLRKLLTEIEGRLENKGRMKYMEYQGVIEVNAVGRKDPWGAHCGRER